MYKPLIFSGNPVGQEERTQLCGVPSCYFLGWLFQPRNTPPLRGWVCGFSTHRDKGAGVCRGWFNQPKR